jgi:hypothetical protein
MLLMVVPSQSYLTGAELLIVNIEKFAYSEKWKLTLWVKTFNSRFVPFSFV